MLFRTFKWTNLNILVRVTGEFLNISLEQPKGKQMKRALFYLLSGLLSLCGAIFASGPIDVPVSCKTSIVGGGIIGALESYYAYKDAQKNGEKICITVYEKGDSFASSSNSQSSTNTSYNIVPSLTIDEILSVVPRGSELVEKLAILFSQPGGIRVDDVEDVNDSESAINFKHAVALYGSDKNHDDRTLALLMLGKRSMDLWRQMYDDGDEELKAILEASNFNPCREPRNNSKKSLHDGYRIDLIYGIPNAQAKALNMKADYEKLGYKNCAILSPSEVVAIDPYLTDFCNQHSDLNTNKERVWRNGSVALWRPGGCIDTRAFLPKFYAYLRKVMGQYTGTDNQVHDCFQLQFSKEVCGVEFDSKSANLRIIGLKFNDGSCQIEQKPEINSQYVFCPGESVGTLHNLGFNEPAYAGFAGASLLITIPLSSDQIERYKNFSHCMEVHKEGIVLAWQARFKENSIFIGVAGTKAFYGEKQPHKDEEFPTNRNLVQLNMINSVLPEFISLAYGYQTNSKTINAEELSYLEKKGIAHRWVGRRAVAYDGFPTIGSLYCDKRQVSNARCTTHLGSGGVSFGPGAVLISRSSKQGLNDAFVQKILMYGDSRRIAN